MRNTDSFYLEPMRCAHIGKVLWIVHCGVRTKKCASARVQEGVVSTHPVALTAVATGWVQNSHSATSVKKIIRTRLRSDFLVDGDNVELVVLSRLAPVSGMLVRLLRKREFEVVSLTIVLTICRPAHCAGAISANSESMKTNSTMLSSVTSWMRWMADDVHLRTFLPCLCSATQGTLAVKDQSCYANSSLLAFRRFINSFFASRCPGPCDTGGPCLFSSILRKWSSFSLLLRRIVVDTAMYNVIQVSNPCVRPVMGKLRFLVDLLILPSVPDWRNPLSPFAALRNASRALWWCCCHKFGPQLLPLVEIGDVR